MVPELPLPAEELVGRLNEALAMRVDAVRMRVERAEMDGTSERPSVRLRISVADDAAPPRLWDVAIPIDPLDLEPDVNSSALVAILHANVREWWDLKGGEPEIARWGRPV